MTALNDAERAAIRRDAQGGTDRALPEQAKPSAVARTSRSPEWLPSRRFIAGRRDAKAHQCLTSALSEMESGRTRFPTFNKVNRSFEAIANAKGSKSITPMFESKRPDLPVPADNRPAKTERIVIVKLHGHAQGQDGREGYSGYSERVGVVPRSVLAASTPLSRIHS